MLSRRSLSLSKYLFDDFFYYSIAAAAFDFFGSSTGSEYFLGFVSAGFAVSTFAFVLGPSSQSSSKLLT